MTKDGGPAFPPAMIIAGGNNNTIDASAGPGLTVRDYFAAAALTGMLQKVGVDGAYYEAAPIIAFKYADSMMEERGES